MINLTKALQNAHIGNQYDLLGYQKNLCGKKRFLSYSKTKGWEVVKLNVWQQFARSFFGAYSSTHLEYVATNLARTSRVPLGLTYRIEELWQKTYPYAGPILVKSQNTPRRQHHQPHTTVPQNLKLFGYQKDISNLALYCSTGSDVFKGLLELDKDYKYHAIAGDGHCLFRAMAAGVIMSLSQGNKDTFDQMTEDMDNILEAFASPELLKLYEHFKDNAAKLFLPKRPAKPEALLRNRDISDNFVKFLRILSSEYNEKISDHFEDFLEGEDAKNPKKYLRDMKNMTRNIKMGGHPEIRAIVECLGLDVTILDAEGIGQGGSVNDLHYKHSASFGSTLGIHLLLTPEHYSLAVVA